MLHLQAGVECREGTGFGSHGACYYPEDRHEREESERFKRYTYDEIAAVADTLEEA